MSLSIEFTLPRLPKSMNQIYNINFGQRHIFLKPDVRAWKSEMKPYIPVWTPADTGFIRTDCIFCYNLFHQNGNLRKVDSQNLLKVLIDTIAEKIGTGDHYFKAGSWCTLHSEEEEWVKVKASLFEIK